MPHGDSTSFHLLKRFRLWPVENRVKCERRNGDLTLSKDEMVNELSSTLLKSVRCEKEAMQYSF